MLTSYRVLDLTDHNGIICGYLLAHLDADVMITRAGPELGEHNFYVLGEVLGYDADRIADIYAALAME